MLCAEIDFTGMSAALPTFEVFMAQPKTTEADPLVLFQDNPKVEYFGRSRVLTGWSGFECDFEATKSPKQNLKYGMIIRTPFFHEKPCFRFCSRAFSL
jgi:hypothetical protein